MKTGNCTVRTEALFSRREAGILLPNRAGNTGFLFSSAREGLFPARVPGGAVAGKSGSGVGQDQRVSVQLIEQS